MAPPGSPWNIQYSGPPSYPWNSQPASRPQKARARSVSFAGSSMCTSFGCIGSSSVAWPDPSEGSERKRRDAAKLARLVLPQRRDRDREVLDGEAGGVEDGDVGVGVAPSLVAGDNAAERRDRLAAQQPALDRVRGVAAVGSLLPLVDDEDAGAARNAREFLGVDLRLAGAV